jgi:hypothetical protein
MKLYDLYITVLNDGVRIVPRGKTKTAYVHAPATRLAHGKDGDVAENDVRHVLAQGEAHPVGSPSGKYKEN